MLLVDFILREARQEEFPAIRAIIREAHINPLDLDWRRFVIAVNSEGEIIGCGQVKPHSGGIRELASIAVIPKYRGRGIARAIIAHLLAENTPPLYLTCRSGLEPFYLKFGFRPLIYDEMPTYYRRLARLASVMMHFRRPGEHLSVMKLEIFP